MNAACRKLTTTTVSQNHGLRRVLQRPWKRHQPVIRRTFSQSTPPTPSFNRAIAPIGIVTAMFVAWGASDWILGDQQTSKNEELRQELTASVVNLDEYMDAETKLYCVVRRAQGWNVTHCLTGVHLGDVVEVLQEGVGPNQEYNLCRLPADENSTIQEDVIGWFPIRFLQKMDDYDRMLEQQVRNLEKVQEEK
jgi:hypothetical protein